MGATSGPLYRRPSNRVKRRTGAFWLVNGPFLPLATPASPELVKIFTNSRWPGKSGQGSGESVRSSGVPATSACGIGGPVRPFDRRLRGSDVAASTRGAATGDTPTTHRPVVNGDA